jgi:hypothetical protein
MRRSFLVVCLSALTMGIAIGCKAAATVDTSSAGKQFRAVCSEKAMHGGNEQVLSKWLDAKEKAVALGEYHSNFKDKGHRWRLEERMKPAGSGESN